MPLGDVPMQYPFPYKNSSGDETSQGVPTQVMDKLILNSTENSTGFFNSTGALQVHGGAQFWKDVFIGGNLYVAGKIYSSALTPIINPDGSLGTVIYNTQAGSITTSVDGSVAIFSLSVSITYTGASATKIYISGLTSVSAASITQIIPDCYQKYLQTPISAYMLPSDTNITIKDQIGNDIPISGNGSLVIKVTGYYLTSAASSTFTPTIDSTATIGTPTYTSQVGKYGVFGNSNVLYMNFAGSYTGASGNGTTVLKGLPNLTTSIPMFANNRVEGTAFAQPLVFENQINTNTAYALNASTLSYMIADAAKTFTLKGNMFFLTSTSNTFTPELFCVIGTAGTVTYTAQIGYYTQVSGGVLYTLILQGSYVNASGSVLGIKNLPVQTGLQEGFTCQIISTLPSPLIFATQPISVYGVFINQSLQTNLSLTAGGTFNIKMSGAYLTL
jgi:hypothetical protein